MYIYGDGPYLLIAVQDGSDFTSIDQYFHQMENYYYDCGRLYTNTNMDSGFIHIQD